MITETCVGGIPLTHDAFVEAFVDGLHITIYRSESRPGGYTVDIEAPEGTDLLVAINDGDVYNQEIPA